MRGVWALTVAGLKGRRIGGVIATIVVLAAAALGIAAGLLVSDRVPKRLDAVAEWAKVPHLVLFGDAASVQAAAARPGVVASAGPFPTTDALDLVRPGVRIAMQLTGLDDREVAVGAPVLHRGRWLDPARPDEIVLERSLADDLGLAPGDRVQLRSGSSEIELVVAGTALDLTDCAYPQCARGRAFVHGAALDRLPASDVVAQQWLRFDDARIADPFVAEVLASDKGVRGSNSWLDTRADLLATDTVFGRFVTGFGAFVLVAACVVVAGGMVARMAARRREIGLLGATGATARQVTTALLAEHLVLGAVAALIGWGLAGLAAPSLSLGVSKVLDTPGPTWAPTSLAITAGVLLVILAAATIVPAWRAGRAPVTEVLRDAPAAPGALAGRLRELPGRLPLLGVREAMTRPLRSLLTALAIAVAVTGGVVAVGFITTVDRAINNPERTGKPWDVLVEDGSRNDLDTVLPTVPGVASWYTLNDRRSTLEGRSFLSRAVGGDPALARFEIGQGRPLRASGEAIAGYGLLSELGLHVGDRFTFAAGGTPLTVEIVGWYREFDDNGVVLQYRLEQLQQADSSVRPARYLITAQPGTERSELAAALRARLGEGAAIRRVDEGGTDVSPFTLALRLIALVLAVVAGANLLSTMLATTRESARVVGVLGAVGCTPRQLVAQGAAAAAALGALAVVVGAPLGLWLHVTLSDAITSSIGAGPGMAVRPGPLALLALAIGTPLLAAALGALAARRLARQPAAELVRWE